MRLAKGNEHPPTKRGFNAFPWRIMHIHSIVINTWVHLFVSPRTHKVGWLVGCIGV